MLFLFVIFAILGVQLWNGLFHQVCSEPGACGRYLRSSPRCNSPEIALRSLRAVRPALFVTRLDRSVCGRAAHACLSFSDVCCYCVSLLCSVFYENGTLLGYQPVGEDADSYQRCEPLSVSLQFRHPLSMFRFAGAGPACWCWLWFRLLVLAAVNVSIARVLAVVASDGAVRSFGCWCRLPFQLLSAEASLLSPSLAKRLIVR